MKKPIAGIAGAILVGAAAAGLSGCGVVQPAPMLPADAFVANRSTAGPGAGEPIDHSGPLVYDAQHRPVKPELSDQIHISKTVREEVRAPATQVATPPGAAASEDVGPSVTPVKPAAPGDSTGQWQWVGSVLAVVNGEPIYADKVIDTVDRALQAEARSGDEAHFRAVAEDLVGKQIRDFIENDLEFAAAQRALEKGDEQIAKMVTGEWRKEQVRKAGGSEALARQRAKEDGQDFDDLVRQQYRINLTRLYYQRKIFPLIQVSAQDMRDYYQASIRRYQTASAARFRVIFISSQATGGREAALDKARRQVYEPAKAGADFADLASRVNDDAGLMHSKGAVGDDKGWMEKGAYAVEKVEQAVWDLKPGEVTEPIDARDKGQDGFFVAKLEELRIGKTESFESQKVQDDIRETLRREQFAKLREVHRRELVQKAVIRENPNMRDAAMEMVMQRYRGWVASR
ncbi:MAG TPA: peptidylprolyl isomerase [Tepidisphaeraceae bacterium]|nr:peptidylprolyl isomerase [Tepidisphaeraceae bacterium]